MTTVTDAIASELALLTREVATPIAPFGYGSDLSCADDLTETMDEVPGLSPLALAQSIVRRLDCPRGALRDDGNYGIDLRSYCNRGVTDAEIRQLAADIQNELTKDDRIDLVGAEVAPSSTGTELRVALAVTPIDPRLGPFSMTLAVTSGALLLQEIQ
jgi:hypothetical protein